MLTGGIFQYFFSFFLTPTTFRGQIGPVLFELHFYFLVHCIIVWCWVGTNAQGADAEHISGQHIWRHNAEGFFSLDCFDLGISVEKSCNVFVLEEICIDLSALVHVEERYAVFSQNLTPHCVEVKELLWNGPNRISRWWL